MPETPIARRAWRRLGRPYRLWHAVVGYLVIGVALSAALVWRADHSRIGAAWVAAWGVALIASPAAFLGMWHRSSHRARTRLASLETLYSYTVKVAALSETADIVGVTLEEARRALGAGPAALRLPPALGGMRYVLRGPELRRELESATPLESQVVTDGRSVGDHRDGGIAAMAVPVVLGELGTAVMSVEGHRDTGRRFGVGDLRFLEAVAANLGTSLISSRRLDQLRSEVSAREHQALHDSLTGLGNRTLFGQWLDSALAQRRDDERVGVLLMDLDGFKDINDTLGHHAGDAVLEEVAARVLNALGPNRLAARLGGDEFAFVVPGADGPEAIHAIAAQVRSGVSQPVSVGGMELEVRASLGVAVAPDDGTDVSNLLRRADVAMYAAKTTRKGLVAYDREIDQYAKRRLVLTNELRKALETNQLEVWYQPLARLGTTEITGMEALLRWRHADYGAIEPAEFVPVAEQSGLIEPITWWVIETSLRELARWRREGFDLTMAVNVSARSLTGAHLTERLARLLGSAGIPAADLTLEITESLMMADPEGSRRVLEDLAGLGVRVAIDDFGTGYSSLARLKRLPVHTVKIDRSFVMSMHRDEGDEAIVRATIELARNMGHEVIAEGVERQDTWDRLATLGCDLAQGHLLAPAMPIEICRSWLGSRQSPQMAAITPLRRARGA
ncbi:MAG: EAL domain-containing protein [Actinomycetota bacterium]|nr:EAL domain-containing protein [Actinomycetota bacterium]